MLRFVIVLLATLQDATGFALKKRLIAAKKLSILSSSTGGASAAPPGSALGNVDGRPLDRDGASSSKLQLYDMPVSNNGARVRMVMYYKDLEDEVDVISPLELGGLKTPEFLAINSQGKMPAMNIPKGDIGNIAESDTIARYLLDRFAGKGPSLLGENLEERLMSNIIARHHDMYIAPIQGCMYKANPPFGIFGSRRDGLVELIKQLGVLEEMIGPRATDTGPFLCGGDGPTLADCTMFPTAVFIDFMLPKFGIDKNEFFGPTLGTWFYDTMSNTEVGARVRGEITEALTKWDKNGRWDTIHMAGKRDCADATIFDKILAKEVPSDIVYEDKKCLAFRDINPVAPSHILVIPKNRESLTQLRFATEDHKDILGHLLVVAAKVAQSEGFTDATDSGGYRIVINDGPAAAQSLSHLHVHIIGGREMTWPPG